MDRRTLARTGVFLVSCLVAAALAGCGASRLIQKGDASLTADRPHQAASFYREALQKEPDLADDAEFAAKLRRARCLSAYEDGRQSARGGRWEEAIEKFSESLRIDPGFEEASAALEAAKRRAAGMRYDSALARADEGRLETAADELKQALRLDPDHTDARAALDSLAADGRVPPPGAYADALALKEQKRWLKASEALAAVISADPNRLPARAELKACKDALAQARSRYAAGSRLLAEKKLDPAITALEESLAIWPFHEAAGGALSQAQARRRQFDDLYRQATTLSRAGRYDEAAASAAAALEIIPHHPQARELHTQARLNAAAIHVENRDRLLTAGKLAEAEGRFARALTYAPEMQAAKDGLARACSLRGQAAESKSLWGNALLWYAAADQQAAGDEYAAAAGGARAKVVERISFNLALEANDAALASRVAGRLFADKPGYVTLLAGRPAAGQSAYAATITLSSLDVRDRLVRTEHRVHRYKVHQDFANPRIPALRLQLAEARRELERLGRPHVRACPDCKGKGTRTCQRCRGKGTLVCQRCRGKGYHQCPQCKGKGKAGGSVCSTCGGIANVRCKECGGVGSKPCPVCEKRGHLPCRSCQGKGRRITLSKSRIEEKQREIGRLTHELSREPLMIRREVTAEWPYAVLHYERTGTISARLRLVDAGGAVLATRTVHKSAGYQDCTTDKPNPHLGLPADTLDFPSDGDVRSALLGAAAGEAARAILAAAIDARISHFNAAAKELNRAGKTDQAVEAMVNTAVLMEVTNPGQAAKLFRELRDLNAVAAG